MRIEEGFQQAPYDVFHPYADDTVLPGLLRRLLPQSAREEIEADLIRCGKRLVEEIRPLSAMVHHPSLVQYDHWGRRVDELHTSEGWRKLEEFGIKEGFVSIAYQRKYDALSRVYSSAKILAITGDCHVVMCPLGMTDGAARIIEVSGTEEMKRELLPRLISRDPSFAYMAGQWMTERPGGSDVSQSETTAIPTTRNPSDLGPPYLLNGFKWFSSAAEGNIAVALGRTSPVSEAPGSRGLSLFVIPLRHGAYPTPLSNGVRMHRLKNKFGTHGVPTTELELENTRGWLIGELGQGVKTVATVLNVTRILSALHLSGSLQRSISIARSYALVRTIDGGRTLLSNTPLHVATLADATLLYRAVTYLAFGTIELLGKSECGAASITYSVKIGFSVTLGHFQHSKAIASKRNKIEGFSESHGSGLFGPAFGLTKNAFVVVDNDMFSSALAPGSIDADNDGASVCVVGLKGNGVLVVENDDL